MKTSSKALFLSLLSVLLISAAISVFLLVARGRLLTRLDARATDVAALEGEVRARETALPQVQAERDAVAATATIRANELQNELDRAGGEIESLTSTLGETEDTLAANSQALADAEATLEAAALIPPRVTTTGPSDETVFLPEEPIPFTVFVTDEDGLGIIQILVNGEVMQEVNVAGEGQRTLTLTISESDEGPLEVAIDAEDIFGNRRTVTAFSVIIRDYVAENEALLQDIAANVAALRGIEPDSAPPLELVDEGDLVARQVAQMDQNLTGSAVRVDPLVWRAFDFVEPGYVFDESALADVDGALSTTAFYDPDLETLLLREPADTLTPFAQWTYVGAYARALLDTVTSLNPARLTNLSRDEALARLMLVEGDVTVVQQAYVEQGLFPENVTRSLPPQPPRTGGEIPGLLLGPLPFPYEAGTAFVSKLVEENGWDAVDKLYDDPPLSTEQILHPERFAADDVPVTLTLPAPALSSTWQLQETETLGEYMLRLYLAQYVPEDIAVEAAAGWDGDRYAVYWNEESDQVALLWDLVWDEPEDVDGFAAVFAGFAVNRANGAAETVLESGTCWTGVDPADVLCLGSGGEEGRLRVVRAPNLDLATVLLNAGSDGP